ncbi:MAG: YceI family protein [Flavobacteriaceae bacterium]|nr:YceI family protein [Flavobacteriaceae bacterium]
MKKSILSISLFVLATFALLSFKPNHEDKKQINIEKSQVKWKGEKVTGSHEGLISLKGGSLTFENSKLTGGEFVMDMASINVTDLEGEYKGKLEGHLKADDFFGTSKFPTAKLVMKMVKETSKGNYNVVASLTIKGITESVTFDMVVSGNKATVSTKIDRTKYGIKYGSASFFDNLKDKAIYDEFDLNVELVF